MRKICIAILSIFLSVMAYSQGMTLHDPVSGRTFNSTKYSDISGSPFLRDKWTRGAVITSKGTYHNLELKLDAYSNTLYFNKDDSPYEFQDNIISFVLMPDPKDSLTYLYYRKGLSGSGIRGDQYVQVLAQGKADLYKLDTKLLSEINQINQGVVKSFTNASRYYIMQNDNLEMIRPNKSDILNALSDKKNEVQAFIDANNLSFKKDADLAKLFKYYNSL
ncbi:MAG TPA: hypothetical protein VEB42_04490 [Chitinophagaceae bacterium]|nr:hypothetical protein [Chitinophagaceae bacterium]